MTSIFLAHCGVLAVLRRNSFFRSKLSITFFSKCAEPCYKTHSLLLTSIHLSTKHLPRASGRPGPDAGLAGGSDTCRQPMAVPRGRTRALASPRTGRTRAWGAPHAREGAGTDVTRVPLAVSQSRFAQEEAKTPEVSGARPQRMQRRQRQGQARGRHGTRSSCIHDARLNGLSTPAAT